MKFNFFVTLTLATGLFVSFAHAGEENYNLGKAAMDYVISQNKKINRDPQPDIKKITSICGTPVSKGCTWKKAGSDKWTFQKLDGMKPVGKIYDVPGFLSR